MEQSAKWGRWFLAGLIVLFLACQLVEIGQAKTLRGDETFYIQAAHTMIQSGDWLTPRFESGDLRFMKPILPYWLVALPMQLFGLSLAAARFPSVILTLATLPFVFALAKTLLRDETCGYFAAAVYLTTETVYSNAHQARTDVLLAFFVAGAIYFFVRIIFEPGRERRDALLAYAMTSGAILTKGMAGIALIFLPLAAFIGFRWKSIGKARLAAVLSPRGWALLLLLTVPWFAITISRHGDTFTEMFFKDQVTVQVARSKWHVLGNLAEYPWLFFKDSLPWSIPVLLALVIGYPQMKLLFKERREQWLFLAAWFAATCILFVAGNVTRGRYLLPVLPAFAVLTAFVMKSLTNARLSTGFRLGNIFLAVGGAITGILFLAHTALPGGTVAEIIPAVALILAAAAAFLLLRAGMAAQAALTIGGMFVIATAAMNFFFVAPGRMEACAALGKGALAANWDVEYATVGLSKQDRTLLLLGCGKRPESWAEKPAQKERFLADIMAAPEKKLIVTDDETYNAFPEDLRAKLKVLDSVSRKDAFDFAKWRKDPRRKISGLLQPEQVTVYLLLKE